MNVTKLIEAAQASVDNNPSYASSARLCLSDAIHLYNSYDFNHAKERALKSLAYSVGVYSKIYREAVK